VITALGVPPSLLDMVCVVDVLCCLWQWDMVGDRKAAFKMADEAVKRVGGAVKTMATSMRMSRNIRKCFSLGRPGWGVLRHVIKLPCYLCPLTFVFCCLSAPCDPCLDTVAQAARRMLKLKSIVNGNDPTVIKERVASLGSDFAFVEGDGDHGFVVMVMVSH
jgi:hypothetical protein